MVYRRREGWNLGPRPGDVKLRISLATEGIKYDIAMGKRAPKQEHIIQ